MIKRKEKKKNSKKIKALNLPQPCFCNFRRLARVCMQQKQLIFAVHVQAKCQVLAMTVVIQLLLSLITFNVTDVTCLCFEQYEYILITRGFF